MTTTSNTKSVVYYTAFMPVSVKIEHHIRDSHWSTREINRSTAMQQAYPVLVKAAVKLADHFELPFVMYVNRCQASAAWVDDCDGNGASTIWIGRKQVQEMMQFGYYYMASELRTFEAAMPFANKLRGTDAAVVLLLHEFAHLLAGKRNPNRNIASHGAEYNRALLDVLEYARKVIFFR